MIITVAWSTELRRILRSSLGSVGKTTVISEQYLLGIQEQTVTASGYVAANPVFMTANLPCELSVIALSGSGGRSVCYLHTLIYKAQPTNGLISLVRSRQPWGRGAWSGEHRWMKGHSPWPMRACHRAERDTTVTCVQLGGGQREVKEEVELQTRNSPTLS